MQFSLYCQGRFESIGRNIEKGLRYKLLEDCYIEPTLYLHIQGLEVLTSMIGSSQPRSADGGGSCLPPARLNCSPSGL